MVPGKDMKDCFRQVGVGEIDYIQGKVDYVIYNLWEMKGPNYAMKIMSTGGRILADDICKGTIRRQKENVEDAVKKFKYKIPFDWHFSYHHAFDDRNNMSHALLSNEDTWMTDGQECQVFAFILDI